MKESHGEDLASHTDPRSCTVAREGGCEVLAGACAGGQLSREIIRVRGADVVSVSVRPHLIFRYGERYKDLTRSKNLRMYRNTHARTGSFRVCPLTGARRIALGNLRRTSMMHEHGKSDTRVVYA